MKLDGIVRAHEFMHIERPPVLWEADTQDEVFIRLLGEMIAFALQRSPDVSSLTLNVANVVVDPEASSDRMPAGEYVAVTVRGPGMGTPELTWGRMHPSHLVRSVTWMGQRQNRERSGSIRGILAKRARLRPFSVELLALPEKRRAATARS